MNESGRLDRIILLCRSIWRFICFGKAQKTPEQISSIVVMPTGKLGDLVCNTPVFKAIREKLPKVKIIVVGNIKILKSVFENSGLIDEYLDIESKISVLDNLKSTHAQAALITGPSFAYVSLAYISGIPLVVAPRVIGGFSPAETLPYKILKNFIRTFPYEINGYAPRERLKVLESISIFSFDTQKILGYSSEADAKIKQFFIKNNIGEQDFLIGICPTAGNKIKEWPEERFAKVASYLGKKYEAKILVIGGPNDLEKVLKTASSIDVGVQSIQTTEFNIDELKALISKLNLLIAVDTGHIYIAEAFGVPTIDIVGPVDERVQPPRGHLHRNVLPPYVRKPQMTVLNARSYNKVEAQKQVLSISVEDVIKETEKLLQDIGR